MTDLASWLLEQIAEDERQVDELRESDYGDRTLIQEDWSGDGIYAPDLNDFGGLWITPARVLAECEAKRRIIDEHPKTDRYDESIAFCLTCENGHARPGAYPCYTLRLLALPYADRPGFREEWRP